MDGVYYVRIKSSLTGKNFWENKAFEKSRKSCSRFAEGNRLASKVYRMIDKEKRAYKLFCFLKKRAILSLKEGKCVKETEEALVDYLMQFGFFVKSCQRCQGKMGSEVTNKVGGKNSNITIIRIKHEQRKIISSWEESIREQRKLFVRAFSKVGKRHASIHINVTDSA